MLCYSSLGTGPVLKLATLNFKPPFNIRMQP
jgi:hypothetical protein